MTPPSRSFTRRHQLTAMQEINFKVTVDEANLILEGLGNLAFARVYGLVAKLQRQAGQQLPPPGSVRAETAPPTLQPDAAA